MSNSAIGIIIDNEDPDRLGRVQVYLPEHDAPLDSLFTKGTSEFKFPGNNVNGDLTEAQLEKLKRNCSWYYLSSSLSGGGASASYEDGNASVSFARPLDSSHKNPSQMNRDIAPYSYSDGFSDPCFNFTRLRSEERRVGKEC